jgi:Trk K+ transport system NAD-binding subunit
VIVDALLSSRLAALSGGIRGRPRDHVVVCGLGRIGTAVATRLHDRGVSVVAVEHDENALGVARARQLRIPVIIGPAGEDAVLEAAGVGQAEAVLAVTDNDSVNLGIGLMAKQVNENVRVVSRVFDHDLAARVERRLRLGATRSVSMLAAPAFAAAALGRRTRVIMPIGRWVLVFAEITVRSGSRAVGRPVADVAEPGISAVLALQRTGEGWRWHPPAGARLAVGDQLAVVGTRNGLARMLMLTKVSRPSEPGRVRITL